MPRFRTRLSLVVVVVGVSLATSHARAESFEIDRNKSNVDDRELSAEAVRDLSPSRALVRLDPDSSAYAMHLRFVVARGCEQTYFHAATPSELPKLFPRIKSFKVRRPLDDGFLVDAEEGFIGIPLTYPVRVRLDEADAKRRVVRIHSIDDDSADKLAPSDAADVVAVLTDVGHPHYCRVDFRAKTTLPSFVPDAAVDLALGYSENEIAFAIREALLLIPAWPDDRRAPLLTPAGQRKAASRIASRRAKAARAKANAAKERAIILREQAIEAKAKADAISKKKRATP